ncbi:MAG: hypothetical protein MRK01_05115 [Candidatus Scalindua sp.]|nr:hypothetical protein [Candidatus Scalindua sp.]
MKNGCKKKKVVVCGEKLVAERCLQFLYSRSDTEICAIVAAPEDWQADLISFGAERRIKTFVGNINDYVEELVSLKPDFIFSLQYRSLLKTALLNLPIHGCINLHFGLLPRYGGCYPVAWAILNGEKKAGVTLHYMVDKFDEGGIIAQTSIPIDDNTTARELFDSLTETAVHLFIDSYPSLLEGTAGSSPQDLTRKLYYTKDSIEFARDQIIDWRKTGSEIHRRICAFSFDPFQQPVTSFQMPDGQQLQATVGQSRLYDRGVSSGIEMAGNIKEVTDSGALVAVTANGDLIEIGLLNNRIPREYIESLGVSAKDIVFK